MPSNKDESMLEELFDDFDENKKKKGTGTQMCTTKKVGIFVVLVILIVGGYYFSIGDSDTKDQNIFLQNTDNSSVVAVNSTNNVNNSNKDYDNNISRGEVAHPQLAVLFKDKSFQSNSESRFSHFWGEENLTQLPNGSLKIAYPKGSYKPSETPRGGAGFIYDLGDDFEKLSLTYSLQFAKNFDFVKGGKLPGLCGGDCARGGMESQDGFSLRFTWDKDGYLDLISALPSTKGYGEYTGEKVSKLIPGERYEITQEVVLNSVGKKDGVLTMYVDGKKVYEKNDVVFRKKQDLKIDSILFSTFFGGSDDSWATPIDTFIIFKDFKISK